MNPKDKLKEAVFNIQKREVDFLTSYDLDEEHNILFLKLHEYIKANAEWRNNLMDYIEKL